MFVENDKKEPIDIAIKDLEQVSGGAGSTPMRCPRCGTTVCYYNPSDSSSVKYANHMLDNHKSGCSGSNTGHH